MNLESIIRTACLMECTAPKPGNVHPDQSFDDLSYPDFARSAPITARWLSRACELGVGQVVENAATEIMRDVGQNTHLGILLLLAPLAAATDRADVGRVLANLTVEDARHAYRAIRIMEPGGLGSADEQDVRSEPTQDLLECMTLAAKRDSIASQYFNGYADVFRFADKLDPASFDADWKNAVVELQISIMSELPDTLIARKCGASVAEEARKRASTVQQACFTTQALDEFDSWLRLDGHRRNPGTTADLVAGVLFVALREGRIPIVDIR